MCRIFKPPRFWALLAAPPSPPWRLRAFPVYEYPPLRVKQAVVGFGRASKEQVARTARVLLGHDELLKPDEADAVAVALCHAFTVDGLVRNPG